MVVGVIRKHSEEEALSPAAQASSEVAKTKQEEEFEWSYTEQPHASRRDEIVAKHPEVKSLFGIDPTLRYRAMGFVVLQLALAYLARDLPWPALIAVAVTAGAAMSHHTTLAVHETSHNLALVRPAHNKLFGMLVNLPLGVPVFISFMRYHMEHHKYMGEDWVDSDLPSKWEGDVFNTTAKKALWMALQPFFYALRPAYVAPKRPTRWELLNVTVQILFNIFIYKLMGGGALAYIFIGSFVGTGMHPLAGHFISEHYTFVKGQETFSYYGPLNWLSLNVGYHNEHHDMPYVAGCRLPRLRQIAKEFYDTLPRHSSWVKVVWLYITDPTMGPYRRVKRVQLEEGDFVRLNPVRGAMERHAPPQPAASR